MSRQTYGDEVRSTGEGHGARETTLQTPIEDGGTHQPTLLTGWLQIQDPINPSCLIICENDVENSRKRCHDKHCFTIKFHGADYKSGPPR